MDNISLPRSTVQLLLDNQRLLLIYRQAELKHYEIQHRQAINAHLKAVFERHLNDTYLAINTIVSLINKLESELS